MERTADILRDRFGENEPIFAEEALRAFEGVPKRTVYYRLGKAVEEGSVAKAGRGVYYVPTETILGPSVLPPMKVIEKEYLTDGEDIYGYWSGLMLENQMGLTTQNPSVLEIATNKATKRVRRLGPAAGYKDVVIRQPRVEITKDNVEVLMLLDLVTASSLSPREVVDLKNLFELAKRASKRDVRKIIPYYPAKTAKRLMESEIADVLA